jgi:hypothetical protein
MTGLTKEDYAAILRNAADLIDRGFVKGTTAKNRYGFTVVASDDSACCWCASGAVQAAVAKRVSDYDKRQQLSANLISTLVLSGDLPRKVHKGMRSSSLNVLIGWNDSEDRTASEVSGTMRKVADNIGNGVF